MALVEIEETELAALKGKCADLEARLQEADKVIEAMTFEVETFEGWKIRLSQKFSANNQINLEITLNTWKAHPPPEDAPAEVKAERERYLKELEADLQATVLQCNRWEDAWQEFSRNHPAAAKAILQRAEAAKKGP